jgi:hypothetical protein
MSNNYVQVPPNSSGVKLQTFENSISGNTVDAEAMVPVDVNGVPVTAAPGAAAPASVVAVGGSDGTDARAIATDTGGQVKVLVENSPTVAAEITGHAGATLDGTAGSPSTGVLTVQGVSGGTPVPVSNTPASGAIFEVSPTSAANTASNPFFEAITDGTNGVAAVKAASTAAVATDKALVVALSPNTGVVQGTAAANTAGWPVTAGGLAESTAAWTSATTVNTALQVNVAGYAALVVTLNQGTTLTGGVVTFEVSDTTAFTNAYAIEMVRPTQNNVAPSSAYTLVASTNASFVVNVAGWAAFRVRLSTAITGTATVNVGIAMSSASVATWVALGSGSTAFQIISSAAGTAVADNKASVNYLFDTGGNGNPLDVADSVYGGAFSGTANTALQGWSKRRAPTVFKTVQATASGNTAVWTPGSGNKFRLLKVFVQVTAAAALASAGVLTVSFQDGTTGMPVAVDVYLPASSVSAPLGDAFSQEIDLGEFGILSATANNVLNVNLSSAITGGTGNVRVIAMGTEE